MLSTRGSSTRCASLLQRLRGQSHTTPSLLSHVPMQPPFCWPPLSFATCCPILSCRSGIMSWTGSFCALLLCMPSLSEDLKNLVLEDVSVCQSGAVQQHILFQCTFVEPLQNSAHVHVGRHDLAEVFLAFEDITLEECQPWKSPAKLQSSKRLSTPPRARTVSRLASKPPCFPSVSGCPLAASRNVSSFPCAAVHEMSPQRPLTEMSAIVPIFHSAHLHFPPFNTPRLPACPVVVCPCHVKLYFVAVAGQRFPSSESRHLVTSWALFQLASGAVRQRLESQTKEVHSSIATKTSEDNLFDVSFSVIALDSTVVQRLPCCHPCFIPPGTFVLWISERKAKTICKRLP